MIKKIFGKIKFWYKNSRPYTIPITLLTWLVIYSYGLTHGGNWVLGIVAYVGVALVHLATNLSDDFIDFKRLSKDGNFNNNEKASKCAYLRNGQADLKELGIVILILMLIAAFMGLILFITSGPMVVIFALAALPIALLYAKLSSKGLGDAAVILAYGPLMFEGVYYSMSGHLSWEVLFLSLGCAMFVNTILYSHMLMDFDGDITSGKLTLCTRLKTKERALNGLLFFYFIGYLFIGILGVKSSNYWYFLPFLTIPMVVDIWQSLKLYNNNPKIVPIVHPWHYPLDNWNSIKDSENAPFFFRFFYVRNISTYFMLLTCAAILLKG